MTTVRYRKSFWFVMVFPAILAAGLAAAQDRFNEELLKGFTYRNLGPFRAGSWVTSVAVPTVPARDHLYTFYVSFWTGGLWKTRPLAGSGGSAFLPAGVR